MKAVDYELQDVLERALKDRGLEPFDKNHRIPTRVHEEDEVCQNFI